MRDIFTLATFLFLAAVNLRFMNSVISPMRVQHSEYHVNDEHHGTMGAVTSLSRNDNNALIVRFY